jgi:hypothetical protein
VSATASRAGHCRQLVHAQDCTECAHFVCCLPPFFPCAGIPAWGRALTQPPSSPVPMPQPAWRCLHPREPRWLLATSAWRHCLSRCATSSRPVPTTCAICAKRRRSCSARRVRRRPARVRWKSRWPAPARRRPRPRLWRRPMYCRRWRRLRRRLRSHGAAWRAPRGALLALAPVRRGWRLGRRRRPSRPAAWQRPRRWRLRPRRELPPCFARASSSRRCRAALWWPRRQPRPRLPSSPRYADQRE